MVEHLYLHVPFCASKCGYCAFYSVPAPASADVQRYLAKVCADAQRIAASMPPLRSIFIGGGTPTWLDDDALMQLLDVTRCFTPATDMEFSVECNPETLTERKTEILAAHGVNRVSLGVQSMKPHFREILGRAGEPDTVVGAIKMLRQQGIGSLNADLIYGIPTQRVTDCRDDVLRVLDFGVDHLSAYSLTAEEGSRLFSGFDERSAEDVADTIWEQLPEWVKPYGIERYEISNYAKPRKQCRHNLAIWYGAHYLGLGPAASSFIDGLRQTNPADLDAWLQGVPAETDPLSDFKRAAEILAFGLRTSEGWSERRFRTATGYPLDIFADRYQPLIESGLLTGGKSHLRPSDDGLRYWNHIAEQII